MKKRKVNPRRIPVTKAAVDAAQTAALDDALDASWGAWIMTLRDKHGFGPKRLHAVWEKANEVGYRVGENQKTADSMMAQVMSWGIDLRRPPKQITFRRPTAAAEKQVRKTAFSRFMQTATVFFCITLHELYGWADVRLGRIVDEIGKLDDEVREGRITYKDIIEALEDEGFKLEKRD